jgi:hypothetical protein
VLRRRCLTAARCALQSQCNRGQQILRVMITGSPRGAPPRWKSHRMRRCVEPRKCSQWVVTARRQRQLEGERCARAGGILADPGPGTGPGTHVTGRRKEERYMLGRGRATRGRPFLCSGHRSACLSRAATADGITSGAGRQFPNCEGVRGVAPHRRHEQFVVAENASANELVSSDPQPWRQLHG